MADGTPVPGSQEDFRAKLGMRLVFWSTIALAALGAIIMLGAIVEQVRSTKPDNDAVMRAANLLLTSLLPLFGTWVGTVLAFYYTKENYEAASRGTLDAVRTVQQRLVATPVTGAMMKRADVVSVEVPVAGLGGTTQASIDAAFKKTGANGKPISRLLFLSAAGACVGILHRSSWTEMVLAGLTATPPVNATTGTLADYFKLADGPKYQNTITHTMAFVAQTKSLADAKAAMEAVPGCQDVMVTATGAPAEPVVGWISNVDISRLSQA